MSRICRLPVGGRQSGTTAEALVDEQDYEALKQHRWTGMRSGGTGRLVAVRSAFRNVKHTTLSMHREIMGVEPGDRRKIEHINGDGLDNRRENLRFFEPKNPPPPPAVQSDAKPDGPCVQVGGNRPRRNGPPSRVYWALVDEEDRERLSHYAWSPSQKRNHIAAVRREPRGDGTYRLVYMHREVLGVEPDNPLVVDHISGDTLDNRKANLRLLTAAENAQNRRGPQVRLDKNGARSRTSKYRGVAFDRSGRNLWPWVVQLRFPTEDEANEWVVAWRRKYMPFSEEDKPDDHSDAGGLIPER